MAASSLPSSSPCASLEPSSIVPSRSLLPAISISHGRRRQQRPGLGGLVLAATGGGARIKYKGTARREAALAAMIEQKVAEARDACEGPKEGSDGCRVAWDEVEEVSQAKADLRRRLSETDTDPLQPFCLDHPESDECAVLYEDK